MAHIPKARRPHKLKFCLLIATFFCGYRVAPAQQVIYSNLAPAVIEERLRAVQNDNRDREQSLRTMFESAGCLGEHLIEQAVKGSRTPNVVCTLTGTDSTVVVVGAYFDKVRAGQGVVDHWSGALLLPSLFQSLAARKRRFTFGFIGFADEEQGLVGSNFYVRRLAPAERTNIRAMVNIDSLGLSSTKVWVSRADKEFVDIASRAATALDLPLSGMNVENVGDTDSHPFTSNRIPSIDFHSVTQDTLPILYTNRDSSEVIRSDDYYNSYQLLAFYLAELDEMLSSSRGTAETKAVKGQ